ncbi:MAG: leucine-rich repeat domain-containing protein [Cytophagales bacterium]|nr:leucine-rich repeat domain-containing protein [Cytophagales bacterium]
MLRNNSSKAKNKIEEARSKNRDYLDIADANLNYFPEEVFGLTNLRILKLGGLFTQFFPGSRNTIANIPSEIKRLKNLVALYLESNKLHSLPPEMAFLERLDTLVLAQNEFDEFPSVICSLFNLQRLHLNNNRLRVISAHINNLRNLKKLYMSDNEIISLPESIYDLDQLVELRLNNNGLESLSTKIGGLKNLQELYLNRNGLKELPRQIGDLNNLRELHLEYNDIQCLPVEITKLSNLKVIHTTGNPLTVPPLEICEQGVEAIKQWFKSVQDPSKIGKLFEAKLILIGNGQVGKTTLKENLINRNYKLTNHKSTTGLDVRKWGFKFRNDENCDLNIWDFGGQGEYRAIQQFFCSRNSLYLFVTEPEDEHIHKEDRYVGFEYWLNFINLFSSNVGIKCPVIFVHTKSDIKVGEWSKYQMQRKFSNVIDFVDVSCKTGDGLEYLKDLIEANLKVLGILGIPFNISWIKVKEHLDSLDKDYISFAEYMDVCAAYGVSEKDGVVWINYLSSIGSVLYFPKILALKKMVILKPNWVRKAAYDILGFSKTKNNGGEFSSEDILSIWANYNQDDFNKLMEVMKALRLFYKVKEDNKTIYRVPSLSIKELPSYSIDKRSANSLSAKVCFDSVLPADIISQLAVVNHHKIFQNLCWNTEVVFHHMDTYAHLIEDWRNKSILVRVNGKHSITMLDFVVERIQDLLYQIQGSILFSNITIETQLICNCRNCLEDNEPAVYSYDYTKKLYYVGNQHISCPKSGAEVSLASLMNVL